MQQLCPTELTKIEMPMFVLEKTNNKLSERKKITFKYHCNCNTIDSFFGRKRKNRTKNTEREAEKNKLTKFSGENKNH